MLIVQKKISGSPKEAEEQYTTVANGHVEYALTFYYEKMKSFVGFIWRSHHVYLDLDCFYLDLMHQCCYC